MQDRLRCAVHMGNAVNDVPVALVKNFSTVEDTTLTVPTESGLLVGSSDVEEESLTAVLATDAAHGTVTVNPTGSFTYVPVANYHGADGFSYRINDGTDLSVETAVTLAVSSVNDAPVVGTGLSAQNGVYGTAFSFTFDAETFIDVDGDALVYSATGLRARALESGRLAATRVV